MGGKGQSAFCSVRAVSAVEKRITGLATLMGSRGRWEREVVTFEMEMLGLLGVDGNRPACL